ncbi:CPBP family intramembrane metalloprotease [bacterium]|nr:MAG: CPBP family intramembrane metalloprotease [bacterium]
MPRLPEAVSHMSTGTARWAQMLGTVSAAIYEEVFTRLFLMTCIAVLVDKVFRRDRNFALVVGAMIAALAFGALHLPAAAQMSALTPLVVTRVFLLNGIGGLAFAYCFGAWGLEHAMLAHFAAGMVAHGLA